MVSIRVHKSRSLEGTVDRPRTLIERMYGMQYLYELCNWSKNILYKEYFSVQAAFRRLLADQCVRCGPLFSLNVNVGLRWIQEELWACYDVAGCDHSTLAYLSITRTQPTRILQIVSPFGTTAFQTVRACY